MQPAPPFCFETGHPNASRICSKISNRSFLEGTSSFSRLPIWEAQKSRIAFLEGSPWPTNSIQISLSPNTHLSFSF